jgi:hypothetical protein
MNAKGNLQRLVPPKHGNTRAVRHGVYSASGRVLAERGAVIASALKRLAAVCVRRRGTGR